MRRLATILLAAAMPVMAVAQEAGRNDGRDEGRNAAPDAVIRIEAKRGAEAAARAAGIWAETLEGVVTLDLGNGWTGIAIGPMDRAEADRRLAQLKSTGQVPADSFVSVPDGGSALTPVAGAAPLDPAPDRIAPPADPFIRLASFSDETAARQGLAELRRDLPQAGLHRLAKGGFAATLGPLRPEAANAWLPVLVAAEILPADAETIEKAALAEAVEPGEAPDLAAPPAEPLALPSLAEVQEMLTWAGHYDGEIDGQDGPRTRAAIRAEIVENRVSTDPGTAIEALKDRRAAWRERLGLSDLRDTATGLTVTAPGAALNFDRAERALSIYGPKDGSGAALILFSQKGGQQELLDLAGLVTALGWVPDPERKVSQGAIRLKGANDAHIGVAEGRVADGRAEGWVLIWPASDALNQRRIEAEMTGSLTRHAPARNETVQNDEGQGGAVLP